MRVELRSIGKRFGKLDALRDVSLQLESGSALALLGPNGAGKSTLTRAIMGLIACDGEVLLDGRSPLKERQALAHRLAYVPQVAPRLAASVGELTAAVSTLRGLPAATIRAAAGELGLDLDAVRRRPVRDLSGGMRQKLLIAMALASDAELLILDEPTASLDADSRARFFRLVAELERRPTIVLCSHRLEELRHLVDRVLVLEEGRVAFEGDAKRYLKQRARAVLEVVPASPHAERWLDGRGFHRGAAGWWRRELVNGERVAVLEETVTALRSQLADVVVHEQEHLRLDREE